MKQIGTTPSGILMEMNEEEARLLRRLAEIENVIPSRISTSSYTKRSKDGNMNFWTYYTTDGRNWIFDGYETKEQCLDFLNQHAGNPLFKVRLIRGHEKQIKSVQVTTKYEIGE